MNCEKHPHEVPLCSCSMKKGKHPVHVPNFVEATEKLRSKSLKITQQRQAVLNVLQDKHIPLAIKEIHSRPCSIAKSTIFSGENIPSE